jgi:hypothetical protein
MVVGATRGATLMVSRLFGKRKKKRKGKRDKEKEKRLTSRCRFLVHFIDPL